MTQRPDPRDEKLLTLTVDRYFARPGTFERLMEVDIDYIEQYELRDIPNITKDDLKAHFVSALKQINAEAHHALALHVQNKTGNYDYRGGSPFQQAFRDIERLHKKRVNRLVADWVETSDIQPPFDGIVAVDIAVHVDHVSDNDLNMGIELGDNMLGFSGYASVSPKTVKLGLVKFIPRHEVQTGAVDATNLQGMPSPRLVPFEWITAVRPKTGEDAKFIAHYVKLKQQDFSNWRDWAVTCEAQDEAEILKCKTGRSDVIFDLESLGVEMNDAEGLARLANAANSALVALLKRRGLETTPDFLDEKDEYL